MLLKLRIQVPHVLERERILGRQLGQFPESVEQCQLHRGFEQRLLVVLSVDVDEKPLEGLKQAERRGATIDMQAMPPGAREDTPKNQAGLASAQEIVLIQKPEDLDVAAHIKNPRDLRLFSTRSNRVGRRAAADEQIDSIDQDGLSSAGLAGQYRKSIRKLEPDVLDDREVPDAELGQHMGRYTGGARSRSMASFRTFFGTAPTTLSTGWPPLKNSRVGMLMMPYRPATSGFSSVLSFMTLSLPLYSEANSSTTGATIWHGPHHTAQKSTRTRPEALPTSVSQVPELTGVALLTLIPPKVGPKC